MTPEQFERAESLFDQALELEDGGRLAFLQSACNDDDVVRRKVEGMLAQHATPAPAGSVGLGDVQ